MSLEKERGKIGFDVIQAIGKTQTINSQTIRVVLLDNAGKVLVCSGTVTVTDGGAGFAKGCLYIKTDVSAGTSGLYKNDGTTSSCDFNLVEGVEGVISGVTAGTGLSGGGTEGTVTVAVGAGRGTTVRADAVDVGVDIYNNVGSTLTAGTLVNLSGFTTTNGVTVTKADADSNIPATHVVVDAITNNTAGVVYPVGTVTGLATNGQTIGDLVYLSATVGAFAFAAPTGANQLSQIVGVVKVVDASVGEIVFFPGAMRLSKLGTDYLQDLAVSTGKIAANAVTTAKLDEKTIKYAEFALTEANLIAMNGAPVEVLAAPGSGKAIEFISAVLIYDFDTAAYTGGGDVTINYTGGSAVSSAVSAANSFGAAGDKVTGCQALDTANGIPLLVNTGLSITNATAAFADPGTAAGVGRVKIAYRVHTTDL